eukprot:1160579-Pelagomonas_calceolata.AAC.4
MAKEALVGSGMNPKASFFVGDASHPDHKVGDSDREFANAVGMQYKDVKEVFGGGSVLFSLYIFSHLEAEVIPACLNVCAGCWLPLRSSSRRLQGQGSDQYFCHRAGTQQLSKTSALNESLQLALKD